MQPLATTIRFSRFTVVVTTVFLLLSSCDSTTNWTTALGTVSDGAGNPIPDAVVTMKVERGLERTLTDKDGRYLIARPHSLPWKTHVILTVSKEGYLTYENNLTGPRSYVGLDAVLKPVRD